MANFRPLPPVGSVVVEDHLRLVFEDSHRVVEDPHVVEVRLVVVDHPVLEDRFLRFLPASDLCKKECPVLAVIDVSA